MKKWDFSGVYKIINNLNGYFYVGSSLQVKKRLSQHRNCLNKNKHHCFRLQKAWNNFGEANFEFVIVERDVPVHLLAEKELAIMQIGFDNDTTYNTFKNVHANRGENHPMYGKTHSEEARAIIKERRSKQIIKHTNETRAKIAFGNTGKTISRDSILKANITKKRRHDAGEIVAWNKGKTVDTDIRIRNGIDKLKTKINEEIKEYILQSYGNGESINFLSKTLHIDWNVLKKFLKESGISIRNISKQKKLYHAKRRSERID